MNVLGRVQLDRGFFPKGTVDKVSPLFLRREMLQDRLGGFWAGEASRVQSAGRGADQLDPKAEWVMYMYSRRAGGLD